MKVLNLIWGFSLGGVGKCFLTYVKLGESEPALAIHSVCIHLLNAPSDIGPLAAEHVTVVNIRSRLDFSWLPRCRDLVAQHKPDVIFTHGFNGPVVVQLLKWRYGLRAPMICSYHGAYHPPSLNRRLIAPVFNASMLLLYRKRAEGILAVASWCKEFLVQRGVPAEKVVVVHNGIASVSSSKGRTLADLAPLFRPSDGQVVVGIASRLDPVKGLEFLLKAVAAARLRGLNIVLVMLGEGPLLGDLKKVAAELGISESVLFMGPQPNVPEWLGVLDIFALPSLFEYHSIALLEAMRAGKAIVATQVGGNPESVRDGQEALLVPPSDALALAAALVRLAEDPALRTRLGQAARKRFETHFTEAVMKRRVADWLLSFAALAEGRRTGFPGQ